MMKQLGVENPSSDRQNDLAPGKEEIPESPAPDDLDIAIHLVKQIDHSPNVCGVATLDDCIYILSRQSVKVYEDQSPFRLKRTIETTPRILEPWDIASSERPKCVYVADQGTQSIWKITPDDTRPTVWLNQLTNLSTIYVCPNGSVLLIKDSNASTRLVLYDSGAKLLRVVPLQSEIKCPTRAVLKPSGEFIVAHRWRDLSGPWVISQLDQHGTIVDQFKPTEKHAELNFPWYFSLDSKNCRLFVTDVENDRVIVLNYGALKCCKVLLTEKKDEIYHPWRICYDDKNRQLIVGQLNGFVDIYDLN